MKYSVNKYILIYTSTYKQKSIFRKKIIETFYFEPEMVYNTNSVSFVVAKFKICIQKSIYHRY